MQCQRCGAEAGELVTSGPLTTERWLALTNGCVRVRWVDRNPQFYGVACAVCTDREERDQTRPCPECGGAGVVPDPFDSPGVALPCPECAVSDPSVGERLAAVTADLGRIVARLEDLLREVR